MRQILFILFSLALFVPASASEWWDTDWKYRGKIVVLNPRLKSNIDTASFVFHPGGGVNEDLSDIRIIDEGGRETPYKVNFGNNGRLIKDFRVDSDYKGEYYIYFGNPKAEKIEYMWQPTTGGLFLETREKPGSVHPKNWPQMQELIQKNTKIYGKGPRHRIDDLENPFGSNESYLSIYRGNIFCPLNGKYGFATNSDDASFLLVDGKLVASWPGWHEKEGGANKPLANRWTHRGEIYLERGAHLIQYYQEEGKGAQASRAGWRKPGDKEFIIIPKKAFVDKLKARQVSFQVYEKPLNAFFFIEEKESVIFDRQVPELISFQFQDASMSKDSEIVSYQWDFGDGRISSERNPLHVYPAVGTYKVKLHVRDAKGLSDIYEQSVGVDPSSQPKNIQLDWRVTNNRNIFYPEEPLQLGIWVKNYSDTGIKLKLVWESLDQKNDKLKRDYREFTLEPNQVEKVDIPSGSFPMEKTLDFYLTYAGNVIAKRRIEFSDTGSEFKGLRIVENHIEDPEDNLVLLRIKQSTGREKIPVYYSRTTQNRLNIVMLGALLCNKDDDENCRKILRGLIEDYYDHKVEVSLTSIEIPEYAPSGSGLLGICCLEEVVKQNPDLVVCSPGMNEIINRLPL